VRAAPSAQVSTVTVGLCCTTCRDCGGRVAAVSCRLRCRSAARHRGGRVGTPVATGGCRARRRPAGRGPGRKDRCAEAFASSRPVHRRRLGRQARVGTASSAEGPLDRPRRVRRSSGTAGFSHRQRTSRLTRGVRGGGDLREADRPGSRHFRLRQARSVQHQRRCWARGAARSHAGDAARPRAVLRRGRRAHRALAGHGSHRQPGSATQPSPHPVERGERGGRTDERHTWSYAAARHRHFRTLLRTDRARLDLGGPFRLAAARTKAVTNPLCPRARPSSSSGGRPRHRPPSGGPGSLPRSSRIPASGSGLLRSVIHRAVPVPVDRCPPPPLPP
jgi:hypothetical protein